MPIAGEGTAYRRLNVPIIGPTQSMPSGGFSYMNRLKLIKDIQTGLISLTWRQLQAMLRYAPNCDLIMATGDTVSQAFAYLTGRPFVSFISSLSSLYEGSLYIGPVIGHCFRSPRCLAVVSRDPYTAQDLNQQGISKAKFGGMPSVDKIVPRGKNLHLQPDIPMLALLPGSRLPEAGRNFSLQLQLVLEIVKVMSGQAIQFRAALMPDLLAQLAEIAADQGWEYEDGKLTYSSEPPLVEVLCYSDAFADILHYSTLVIGMAGAAVDQSVAIGKAVIQIPGSGPQFTYPFAEAQMRLLGMSVQTIGTQAATPEILEEAALKVVQTLQDTDYLTACIEHGQNRLGPRGASSRIARLLLGYLGENPIATVAETAELQ